MDIDLKDQIAQVLSPDVARQLAATVGMDDRQGKTFVDAAIPALLSAFSSAIEQPGAAKALSDAVSNSDPNLIERLRRALAARDLRPLSEGANVLISVLGQGVRDRLANELAAAVDTPIEAATPALGAVEQAIVAVIGQQDPTLWSDADAIKGFLGQKGPTVAGALETGSAVPLPPETSAVAVPPPPETVAPPPPPAPEASRPAPPPLTSRPPPPPPPPPASGGMTWLIALIIIVILAIGGYYYWTKSQEKPAAGALPSTVQYTWLGSAGLVKDLA